MVERYDRNGESGTNLSLGISSAIRIQSSGLHEIPSRFFSISLLNSHGEMADNNISSYFSV